MKYAIGADSGGSHIKGIAMDLEKGDIFDCCYANSNVDNKASAEEVLNTGKTAIRVAGYTAYFTELVGDLQDETIERATQGENGWN